MIVTHHGEHSAVSRGTKSVGMLEYVHAAVEAGTLAIPQAEDPVILRAGKQSDLLAAPYRSHRQVFVYAGQEVYVVRFGKLFCPPQRLVETTDWRAAVTRDETGGIQATLDIALVLQHG